MHIWMRLLCLLLPLCISGCGQAAFQSTSSVAETLTGALTVYGWDDNLNNSMLSDAIRLFKRQNPNVEVDYRTFSEGEMDTILTTELIAGKGPDVVLFYDEIADPFKTADANIFCDLNPFLEADAEYDRNRYSDLFDVGCYQGGRFFIPICGKTYYLLTSQEALTDQGFVWTREMTLEQFTKQISLYLASHSVADIQGLFQLFVADSRELLPATGLQFLSYDRQEVVMDMEQVRNVTEFWKVLYPYISAAGPWVNPLHTNGDYGKALQAGTLLFAVDPSMGSILLEFDAAPHLSKDLSLLLGALPNVTGERPVGMRDLSAAIRNSSDNKQNAYEFLKVLLSNSIQNEIMDDIPVLNSVIMDRLEARRLQGVITQEERDALFAFFTDMQPYDNDSSNLWEMYVQYFTPYWKDDATFDDCYDKLYSALELYLYE